MAEAARPAIDLTSSAPRVYHGGTRKARGRVYQAVESVTPNRVKADAKKLHKWGVHLSNKTLHMHRGRFVELGRHFRFDRTSPWVARLGDYTVTDDFNVWNASYGDITVGSHCWFGLHNIIMGPVRIGDRLSTGPHVSILGPRHPTFKSRVEDASCTVIGDDVWISAGVIILSGAAIGDGAVIGAGAVVSGRVPANATYVERRSSHTLPRFS